MPSCRIITCDANPLVRPVHAPMPVMLADEDAWQAWLDPALDGAAVSELLVPFPVERMGVRPGNPIMNSGRHEGADCLALAA